MLTLNTIKTTLPGDIEIGEAGSFTRLSLPNGDVLADVQLSTGRLFTSVDLLTASVDDVDTSADELDLLIIDTGCRAACAGDAAISPVPSRSSGTFVPWAGEP